MTEPGPLIARFQTLQAYYVYDVNTNEIAGVNPCVYDVLGDYGQLAERDLIDKHALLHGPEAVLQAIAEINNARQELGLFSSHRLEGLQYPQSPAEIKNTLHNGLEHLILNVTERCNLKCRYCTFSGQYPYQRQHSERDMEWPTAKKALELFLSKSQDTELPIIGLYGGEPLLRMDLIRAALDYVKQHHGHRRINFNLTTNGTLLQGDILDYLAEHEVSAMVSLDGPARIHDRMRVFPEGRGSFDRIFRNLQEAQQRYPQYFQEKIRFNAVVHTVDSLDEIYDFFQSPNNPLPHNRLSISFVDPYDTLLHENGVLPPEEEATAAAACEERFLQAVKSGSRPDRFLGDLFDIFMLRIHQRPMKPLERTHYPNGICIPGVRRLFCTAEGSLSSCERVNPGMKIGDVYRGIDEDRVVELMQQYADLSSPDCRNCWAVRLCAMCFCHLQRNRFDMERKRSMCPQTKATLLKALFMYCSAREANEQAFNYLDKIELT